MTLPSPMRTLVQQKLDAFDNLRPQFEECFQFMQDVHGQRRLITFPIIDIVHYLDALWVCECKDRLLSVYENIKRYEGRYCLQLLRQWQENGDTSQVVEFLQHKLDMLPLAAITRQIHEAMHVHKNDGLADRLAHGREIMLNRGINLVLALDSIFALPEEELLTSVRDACRYYGHSPADIVRQLEQMDTSLYSYMPHQTLAQRNMRVMNELGLKVILKPTDLPGMRSWRVVPPTEPLSPFAEHIMKGYLEMTSPWHNNINAHRFVDRPERSDTRTV
jgi:hypothetical protein